jgi:hypothetical protein
MGLEDEARAEIARKKSAAQAQAAESQRRLQERTDAIRPLLVEFVELARKYRVKRQYIEVSEEVDTFFGGRKVKNITYEVWPLDHSRYIDADLRIFVGGYGANDIGPYFRRDEQAVLDPKLEDLVHASAMRILESRI